MGLAPDPCSQPLRPESPVALLLRQVARQWPRLTVELQKQVSLQRQGQHIGTAVAIAPADAMSRRWATDVGVGSVEELMGLLAAEVAVVRFAEGTRDELRGLWS